ncbi:MAG: T9SS type A sorting domain-containing protein [Spirochaetes bacterium]|nr:T9SS type A sorting domain-containing protein [Spirochaetota bacterium]
MRSILLVMLFAAVSAFAAERITISESDFHSYPNPFTPASGSATFVVSTTGFQSAVLAIYNAQGKVLYTSDAAAVWTTVTVDKHSLQWRGVDNSGKILPAGMYYGKVTVRTTDGDVRTAFTKVVLR